MKDKNLFCQFAHSYVCPCLFGGFGGTPFSREKMAVLLKGYMDQMKYLVHSGRYEREDFTVVLQPAFTNLELFTTVDARTGKQVKNTKKNKICFHS